MLNETLTEVLQNKSCCERRLTAADLPTASRKPLDSESSREAAPSRSAHLLPVGLRQHGQVDSFYRPPAV